MRPTFLRCAALLALTACSDQTGAVAEPPAATDGLALAGRVTDAADILDAAQESRLSGKLRALQQRTQHEMVVVTVPSLNGEDVADYTRALGSRWGIGRSSHNDGVILLLAPNERMARIEVGSGLETVLPNSLCAEIMENEIIPLARAGDLPGAIDAGVTALIARLDSARSRGAT